MTVKELHREAMRFTDLAINESKSNIQKSIEFYQKAFVFEKNAYILFNQSSNSEPTRSVLLKSAVNIAINAGLFREAEIMCTLGLSSTNINEETANDFRDLFQIINFNRHLELKGIELNFNEIQLSLSGNDVGHGIIRSDEFINRIEIIEKLAYRTADRMRNKPFRENSHPVKGNIIDFEPYLSTSRAASYAVTIRFGQNKKQMTLDGFDIQTSLVDELMEGISLVNSNATEKIQEKIIDENYRRNFIALTKQLAPDGEKIDFVGLSYVRKNEIKNVSLTTRREKINIPVETANVLQILQAPKLIELEGVLSFADSDKKTIKLTDKNKKHHIIVVPTGLLSDIVKPYFEENVIIKASKVGKIIKLIEVRNSENYN